MIGIRQAVLQSISAIIILVPCAVAADDTTGGPDVSSESLVVASQNPLASLITLPFQNNMGLLQNGDIVNVLNVQPVIPFELGDYWNLITRTLVPVIGIEDPPPGVNTWSIGDIQQSLFLTPRTPKDPGTLIGFGPILSYPTAADDALGSEQFGVGPSTVVVLIRGPWVYGLIGNHVFSVSGEDGKPDLNRTVLQPFVNYNMATTSAI